jgi:hypothetical protein
MAVIDDKDLLTVLMQKYSLLKQEAWEYIKHYKSHVVYLQIVATAVFAVVAFLLSHPQLKPTPASWFYWWIGATLLTTVSNYLLLHNMDALYQLIMLGQRMAILERRINSLLHTHALMWETEIVPTFYQDLHPVKGITNPNYPLAIYSGTLTFVFSILIPLSTYWYIGLEYPSLPENPGTPWWLGLSLVLGVAFSVVSSVHTSFVARGIAQKMRAALEPYIKDLEAKSYKPFSYH